MADGSEIRPHLSLRGGWLQLANRNGVPRKTNQSDRNGSRRKSIRAALPSGHATLIRAEASVRAQAAVFQPQPPALAELTRLGVALDQGQAPTVPLAKLRRSLVLETTAGLVILALVAVLGTLVPVAATRP